VGVQVGWKEMVGAKFQRISDNVFGFKIEENHRYLKLEMKSAGL